MTGLQWKEGNCEHCFSIRTDRKTGDSEMAVVFVSIPIQIVSLWIQENFLAGWPYFCRTWGMEIDTIVPDTPIGR